MSYYDEFDEMMGSGARAPLKNPNYRINKTLSWARASGMTILPNIVVFLFMDRDVKVSTRHIQVRIIGPDRSLDVIENKSNDNNYFDADFYLYTLADFYV